MDQSEFNSYFRRFGKKISSAAIWSIASQSIGTPELYVKLYKATKDLKPLNRKINDNNLRLYIKEMSISILINLIGGILLYISIALSLIGVFFLLATSSISIMFNTFIFLEMLLLALLSRMVNYIIQIIAWGHLNDFFFSLGEILGAGWIERGTKKLRKGFVAMIITSLLGITFVIIGIYSLPNVAKDALDFFGLLLTIIELCILVGIPFLYGHILLTKGYFELSNLKNL